VRKDKVENQPGLDTTKKDKPIAEQPAHVTLTATPDPVKLQAASAVEEVVTVSLTPNDAPPPPPQIDVTPGDYSFQVIENIYYCKACGQSRHTDPIAQKDLCPVEDTKCPRNT
jgi:hypothetical protein